MSKLADLLDDFRRRPMFYRMDGSPYPPGDAGTLEWARDFGDTERRIVHQDYLWTGIWLSTVHLGVDHNYSPYGPPIIFESMAFDQILEDSYDLPQVRYSTLDEAAAGHARLKRELTSIRFILRRCWGMIRNEMFGTEWYWETE